MYTTRFEPTHGKLTREFKINSETHTRQDSNSCAEDPNENAIEIKKICMAKD